jgi:hypothetical protein
MEELQKAIKEMKNNKSPEIDNMQVELNKMGGYDLHKLSECGRRKQCLRNGERALYAQYTEKEILWTVKATEEYLF